MYKKVNVYRKTQINTTRFLRDGESLEDRLRRVTQSKEAIDLSETPEIYQERAAGVDFACDIRTDRFAVAQTGMDNYTRTHMLARNNKADLGSKKPEDFTYVMDDYGNIIENNK